MEGIDLNSTGSNSDAGILRRPQSVMFSFFGIYLRGQSTAIYSGSIIEAFARVNISIEAVRSTLTRMVKRDLLCRHRHGRKMYFSATERGTKILNDGYSRIWKSGAVNRDWDGQWTAVAFSLPNESRHERHDLRSRLVWAGFGLLQPGLWIAPGVVNIEASIEEAGLSSYVSVMTARPVPPTQALELVTRAFDLDSIADRYNGFLQRWDSSNPWIEWPDDLARQLLLHTDWLQVVRQSPLLPADYLPSGWPAFRAEYVFQSLAQKFEPEADAIAASLFDTISL